MRPDLHRHQKRLSNSIGLYGANLVATSTRQPSQTITQRLDDPAELVKCAIRQ